MAGEKLAIVVTAVRRAALAAGGAVQRASVRATLQRDRDLSGAREVRLDRALQYLVERGRLSRLVAHSERPHATSYYTVPGLRQRVAAAEQSDRDVQVGAVLAFWRETRGRPFSTRSLIRHAVATRGKATPRGAGERARKYKQWWTAGLNLLRREGFIVTAARNASGHVRWALGSEWSALTASERRQHASPTWTPRLSGLRDGGCRPSGCRPLDLRLTVLSLVATKHEQVITLVRVAKAARAAQETSASRRRVLARRPVTFDELWAAAEAASGHAIRTRAALRAALAPARVARAKEGRRPARAPDRVVRLGSVGNVGYYDDALTATGPTYVRLQRIRRAIMHANLAAVYEELTRASALSEAGMVPLPPTLLIARVTLLCGQVAAARGALGTTLTAAGARATLQDEETAELDDWMGFSHTVLLRLDRWLEQASGQACVRPITPSPMARSGLLDVSDARKQLQPFPGFLLRYATELPTRLRTVRTVDVVRARERNPFAFSHLTGPASQLHFGKAGSTEAQPGKAGTPSRAYTHTSCFDRVALAAYVVERFGSPRYAAWACRGRHALGELREPGILSEELLGNAATNTHTSIAAGLGLLDDLAARRALTEYLCRAVDHCGAGTPKTTVAGTEAAIIGLARLPVGRLASAIQPHERWVLNRLGESAADREIRHVALLVLGTWDDNVEPEGLLRL